MEQKIISVSGLNNIMKAIIDSEPLLAGVCVRGELSNYKMYPSGHHYFTLKDKDSSLRCVMFKSSASRLRFRPENGMQVIAAGKVSVYARDGVYQLYCTSITPERAGDLHLAFEQLKVRLGGEGLFDREHKKPLPKFPKRIAVVTSEAGAAVRDMIRVLGKRWPLAKVLVLPVRVQGAEAPAEIAGAIAYADKHRIADLIITGRGGGSIEDLWAFNDERVAKAIFACETPVISAVGHEPDITISDYVADLRAATPSNAAELAVPDSGELSAHLASQDIRLAQAMHKKLVRLSSRLAELASRRVFTDPMGYVDDKRMQIDSISERLESAASRAVMEKKHLLAKAAASLDALSPLKVLSRGYSIATGEKGMLIKSRGQLASGDQFKLTLIDGDVDCTAD